MQVKDNSYRKQKTRQTVHWSEVIDTTNTYLIYEEDILFKNGNVKYGLQLRVYSVFYKIFCAMFYPGVISLNINKVTPVTD